MESEKEFNKRILRLVIERMENYNKENCLSHEEVLKELGITKKDIEIEKRRDNMINKLLLKVKKDMEMTKADMARDRLEDDEFYRGVLSAYQIVLDMAEETKAEGFIYTNDLKNTIIDGGEEIYMAKDGTPKRI